MSFEVEYFTLDATDISNKFVILSGVPSDQSDVALDIITGSAQAIYRSEYYDPDRTNADFGVDGSIIRWDSTIYSLYSGDSTFEMGDRIRVIYDSSNA